MRRDRAFAGKSRLALALVALAAWRAAAAAETPARPNILLFLADDLGYGDLRAYNAEAKVATPHMERLAREGLRFTDAHAPASVCSPSRYGILTGRYPWRSAMGPEVLTYFSAPALEPDRLTLPEMLRAQGYATAAIGKWHLGFDLARVAGVPDFSAEIRGGPLDHGFDAYFGKAGQYVRAFVDGRRFVGSIAPDSDEDGFVAEGWDETSYGVDEAQRALQFLERSAAASPRRPFFLYYASHSPHVPYASPAKIGATPIAGASGAGARGDELLEGDAILGLLLAKLDELGLARDTLVLLTSDNGPVYARKKAAAAGNTHDPTGGLRGRKKKVWEGGQRVPLIARWGSKIQAGAASDALVGLQDIFATCAELAGARLPADAAEDSESFRHALLVQPCTYCGRRELVHSAAGTFAIREGRFKLVLDDDGPLLFDLARDPDESEDIAAAHPDVVARLKLRLEQIRER